MTDATFWNKIAPKYATDPISDMPAYEYTLQRTTSYLTRDDRVLELGCGTGSTAIHFAPNVREIVGTDLSDAMVEIANGKAAEQGLTNATFRVASAIDATRRAGSVDVILAHNLFHLMKDAETCFAAIHRALPNGGYFISKTPCLGDRAFGFKRFPIRAILPLMQMIGKAPYVRFLSQPELESAMEFAGFEIVEAGNFPATSRYIVAKRV